ncbi:SulP family inorganic anion transporter [Flavihumibacter profundi]|uniref:SulP family inorganic anion transporter n=1 Tax=Flavihumibacter profundi TaxID=2716883 RepID=UPI001CC48FEF|nr:SulP family inorganic anion transporter [Flavihumibacter profundi]MBZ5857919.1 SulP family inorganic anion transporter [Flavihumibacter profundi]
MSQRNKTLLKNISADLPASIVVFLIALPLCLGIALGSNSPLFSGIIAGIVGGIVIGLMSGSQLSVSGPAAGLTAIVAGALGKIPTFEIFLVSVVLAGVFQIILGFLKAGVLGDFVPGSVIKAMLAAIGIILILKQLPHLIGYNADFEGDETFLQPDGTNTFSGIFKSLNFIHPLALGIGLFSLLLQIAWEKGLAKKFRLLKQVPAPLVVVLIAVGINQWFIGNHSGNALPENALVSIPIATSFDGFTSLFRFPDFSQLGNLTVWTTALTLAIVASLETLLNIEASDEMDPYQRVTPTNRELKAQGVGNVVSGLLGGLPVTSVIVRTSANINAGAKTKTAAVMHGVLLFLSIAFFPGLLNLIPLPALAAILIFTGFKMAKPAIFTELFRKGFDQFIPFVVTIVAILVTDLLVGILIGCLVGLFFVMRSNFKSAVFVVSDENRHLFRLRKDVSFLNKPLLKRKLEEVPMNAYVLIDASRADFIDRDVIEVIEDFRKHANLKNINVELKKSQFKDHGF